MSRSGACRISVHISGHGYGHLAQTAAVLAALRRLDSRLELRLVCPHPRTALQSRIAEPFTHIMRPVDVALVQDHPMHPDLARTRAAHLAWAAGWAGALDRESAELTSWQADLVLSNIACLPLVAARRCGVPAVALASLWWPDIIAPYFPGDQEMAALCGNMRAALAHADVALLSRPCLPDPPFPRIVHLDPVWQPNAATTNTELRQFLGVDPTDRRPLVLVSLGGIVARDLPFLAMQRQNAVLWLVDQGHYPEACADNILGVSFTAQWPFGRVLSACDAVVGKPGYGMVVECTVAKIPLLYMRRHHFCDEVPLCHWLHQHNRAKELDASQFQSGEWQHHLEELWSIPAPPPPSCRGAEQAAEAVARWLPIAANPAGTSLDMQSYNN
ncbi:MAG: hypothetical protein H7831_05740 [Magnetococcus sp. WYHC-3]